MTARSYPWLLALALALTPVCASAQEPAEPPVIPTDGTEVFCWLLKSQALTAVPSINDLRKLPPEQTLVVLFGRTHVLDQVRAVVGDLRRYRARGGSILIASDYPTSMWEWGVTIPAEKVEQAEDSAYRNNPDCPLLRALAPDAPPGFHELPHGLATNRPSSFRVREGPRVPGMPALVRFNPDDCRPQRRRAAAPWGAVAPPYVLHSRDEDTPGRVVLIAGHGLFTNGMLLQNDNDNFRFADDCLRWLRQGSRGQQRVHALFVVDGEVVSTFETTLKPPVPPVPPMPTPTIQLIDRLLAGMEREGFLFHVLNEVLDVGRAVRAGLVLLTGLMLLYGAKRLMEQRHHAEAGATAATGPLAAPPDRAPLVRQRYRSQIARDGLWEEARALVRAWFQEMTGIAPAEWDRTGAAPTPAVIITGGWWQRRVLSRDFDHVADFAAHRIPTAFSWRDLVRLMKALHRLTNAIHGSRLQFADGSPVRIS